MALKARTVSFLWGFAEATFFFVVPDVWLTRIALSDLKEAMINALVTLAGALMGGALIYGLGTIYFDELRQSMDFVPAISERLIESAGVSIEEEGVLGAFVFAGFTGQPYKIYAAWSGNLSITPLSFFLASLLARLSRFSCVIIVAWGACKGLGAIMSDHQLYWAHTALWIVFYSFYFYLTTPW